MPIDRAIKVSDADTGNLISNVRKTAVLDSLLLEATMKTASILSCAGFGIFRQLIVEGLDF